MTTTEKETKGSIESKKLVGLGTDSSANETIYDKWADDYASDVLKWGYTLPWDGTKLVAEHLATTAVTEKPPQDIRIWMPGAGDGLTGVALRQAEHFPNAHVTGSDISQAMLAKAAARGCYNDTLVLDLNQPLTSIASDTYDVVQCLGTLTYVSPEAGTLAEFIRICRPSGLVLFSHRTDKLHLWEATQESLDSQWKLVKRLGPLPYLPLNPDYGESVQVVLFLYQVL